MNLGLAVLVMVVGWVLIRERKTWYRTGIPELSRQEIFSKNYNVPCV